MTFVACLKGPGDYLRMLDLQHQVHISRLCKARFSLATLHSSLRSMHHVEDI